MDTRNIRPSFGDVPQTVSFASAELSAHQLAPSLDEGGVANVHPNLMPPNSPSPSPPSPSPELSWIPHSEGSPSPDLHLHRLQQLSPGGFALSGSSSSALLLSASPDIAVSGSSVASPTIAGTVSILDDGGSENSHPNLHNASTSTIAVYVDDLVLACSCARLPTGIKSQLSATFLMKDDVPALITNPLDPPVPSYMLAPGHIPMGFADSPWADDTISPPEPRFYKEFMRSPEASEWKAACDRELEALVSNQTWCHVPWVPPTRIAVLDPCGGVFSTSEAEYYAHLSQ
jgi:hypothetical protein